MVLFDLKFVLRQPPKNRKKLNQIQFIRLPHSEFSPPLLGGEGNLQKLMWRGVSKGNNFHILCSSVQVRTVRTWNKISKSEIFRARFEIKFYFKLMILLDFYSRNNQVLMSK
jgi:hypothetical protein